jgi:hypothetical protein
MISFLLRTAFDAMACKAIVRLANITIITSNDTVKSSSIPPRTPMALLKNKILTRMMNKMGSTGILSINLPWRQ